MTEKAELGIMDYIMMGSIVGGIVGGLRGARLSSLQFYLEHQHYAMATQQDWYMYFKMKNYAVMKGFIRQGLWMGACFGITCATYYGIEQAVKLTRERIAGKENVSEEKDHIINACIALPIFAIIAKKVMTGLYSRKWARFWYS